ncbi:hypothetical protein [Haloarcula sp. JP-L23]|uniref:hypothetical protein n=1 Tax=Haloarcula sp. JP-L23 TaxID=2716717 RepID=UPI00140EC010|nr:hypothetical protein G9465_00400 [Haloarcula sp. JP-L23]
MTAESLYYRVQKRVVQSLTRPNLDGQLNDLEQEDWDVVIILDACRADTLQQEANWPVQTVRSPASCTRGWIERIGQAGTLSEARVVSANPKYFEFESGAKEVEPYWETHWDNNLQTVPPEPILDRVTELISAGESPVVGHLLQPHWPYVARTGDSWRLAYENLGPWSSRNGKVRSLQEGMERGFVEAETALMAYQASVSSIWRTILPYIEQWAEDTTVVVTSDHGETFGRLSDFGLYEHPNKCHVPPLTEVPWVKFEALDNNRDTVDSIDEQLEALGYA